MKRCNDCLQTKPLEEFPNVFYRGKIRKRSYCKECNRKNSLKAYYVRKENPDYVRQRRNNDRQRKLRHYNLSVEDFEAYGESINWRCEICFKSIMNDSYIDHDHEIGTVRGFLCFHCNVGIGHFGDSIDRLLAAIDYLSE